MIEKLGSVVAPLKLTANQAFLCSFKPPKKIPGADIDVDDLHEVRTEEAAGILDGLTLHPNQKKILSEVLSCAQSLIFVPSEEKKSSNNLAKVRAVTETVRDWFSGPITKELKKGKRRWTSKKASRGVKRQKRQGLSEGSSSPDSSPEGKPADLSKNI